MDSDDDDIPFLKPRAKVNGDDSSSDNSLRLSEVQEAMKGASSFLKENTEWVTEDLLKKVQGNPRLAKAMADPRCANSPHTGRR